MRGVNGVAVAQESRLSHRGTPTPRSPGNCSSASAPFARIWTGSGQNQLPAPRRPDPPGSANRPGL